MTPETEVISCPACSHLVRVPLDWLGTQVQCPECKALFRAPTRVDGKLTGSELLSRPAPASDGPKARKRLDVMLLLPAFGLLLCGAVGGLVNGYLVFFLMTDPAGGRQWAEKQVQATRQMGMGAAPAPEKQAEQDAAEGEKLLGQFKWILPVSFVVSAVVFLGGLSIVLRWNYRLARVACVLAAVNFAHLCCVPGAVAGLWGLLMLASDEGREHFQR